MIRQMAVFVLPFGTFQHPSNFITPTIHSDYQSLHLTLPLVNDRTIGPVKQKRRLQFPANALSKIKCCLIHADVVNQ
jgi:hypothetical protein